MTGRGATILGVEGARLTRAERSFFAGADPFGFVLFARNVEDPEQLLWLTTELREAVGWNVPVFIDQEGGRVARLGPPHWRVWLAPSEQVAQNPKRATRAAWLRYRIIAEELRGLGIDANMAPVVDIAQDGTHPVLKNRCWGDDVVHVADIAASAAEGLLAGGVLPVIKHIPGQGRAVSDSHAELPRVEAKEKVLRVSDFLAFEAVSGLPMAMTAHVVYTAIDPERPATLSPDVIARIRDTIKFGGLLMTDDISMGALTGPLEARSAGALEAGCDVVLHCNGRLDEMRAVVEAAGEMKPAAAARAKAALAWRLMPEAIDIAALEDEFQSLMMGQV